MTIPKGKLLIIGGHEAKGAAPGENLRVEKKRGPYTHFEILARLILKTPRLHHVIEIIASASSIPDEMEALYIHSFQKEGFSKVGFIKVENGDEANCPQSIKRIQGAHAVFFTGGDQHKLVSLMRGTDLMEAIKRKYQADEHFIVSGTSAGAMAIPEIIIGGGIIGSALYKEDIRIEQGLDLISDVIVDTHFIKRGRFARLANAVTLNPACLGIGLEEDTALLISEGYLAECIGSGMVILIDGTGIKTNSPHADKDTPIVIENLVVSIIAEGSRFSLTDRKVVSRD